MSGATLHAITCPACAHPDVMPLYETVNAERWPAARDALRAGSFHRHPCAGCGLSLTVERPLLYIDPARGQWIHCLPDAEHVDWQHHAEALDRVFADNFDPTRRPPAVAALGATLRPELVFGLAALRERVLAADAGLDPALIEVLKLDLLRARPELMRHPDHALVLEAAADDHLLFAALAPDADPVVLRVERRLLEPLIADRARLALLWPALFNGPWRSIRRYRLTAPAALGATAT